MNSLNDIEKLVNELALKIDADSNLLPTYGHSIDFAYPHIEVDRCGNMHYVVVERGEEHSRKTTNNIDELLYWIFEHVTFAIACKFELKHRVEDKDCRRMIFQKQEELLGVLDRNWEKAEKNIHEKILEDYPFDDLASLRATYWGLLRKQGYSEIEIEKMAYEKYPKNLIE